MSSRGFRISCCRAWCGEFTNSQKQFCQPLLVGISPIYLVGTNTAQIDILMSVKFVNYTVVPYAGTLSGLNVGICTPSSYVPRVVPIVIDWSKYPSGGVQVNLNAQGILNPIDFIRSVVIDNLQQGSSIEIQFPDTNFTIVCPGNDILSAFAFKFQLNVLIFNTGSPLVNTTTVYLC